MAAKYADLVIARSYDRTMELCKISNFVCIGHDFLPMVYVDNDDGSISFIGKLDAAIQKEAETMSAMAKFRSMDKQALGTSSSKSITTHLNAIKYVSILLRLLSFIKLLCFSI